MVYCLFVLKLNAQSVTTELTAMDNDWSLQGAYNTMFGKDNKFSFFCMGRVNSGYSTDEGLMALSISSFGYTLNISMKTTAGAFYSSYSGFKPTAGVQFFYVKNGLQLLFSPTLSFKKELGLMNITSIQYVKGIAYKLEGVFKMQSFAIFNIKEHQYTTFRLRVGIQKNKLQCGLASNLNFSERSFDFDGNYGLFVQYKFL